jgi:hypothetical protein
MRWLNFWLWTTDTIGEYSHPIMFDVTLTRLLADRGDGNAERQPLQYPILLNCMLAVLGNARGGERTSIAWN